jgi:hypothetical protein
MAQLPATVLSGAGLDAAQFALLALVRWGRRNRQPSLAPMPCSTKQRTLPLQV